MKVRQSPQTEILHILKLHGPLSAAEIAAKFGTGVSAVRPHLERLAADETVSIEVVRGGRGRPSYRYQLTDAAEHEFPNDYESLAVDLFDGAEKLGGDEMLGKLFQLREEALYRSFKPRVNAEDLEGKLQQVNEFFNELGYMAYVEKEEDDYILYARNCPVPAISDHSSLPCECERNLLSRLLQVEVRAEEVGYDASRPCKFKVMVAR